MDMENEVNISGFWDFLSGLLVLESPLWNWRIRMSGAVDFERFRTVFLQPEERFAILIICPEQCNQACGFRKIKTASNGTLKAVCHQHLKPSFMISNREALMHGVNMNALLAEVVRVLKIEPRVTPFKTWENAWDMGCVRVEGVPLKVFFTLRNWDHEVIDLILNLNRLVGGKYLLLVSSRSVMSRTSEAILDDGGAVFIPLNEVLDFDAEVKMFALKPLDAYLEPPCAPSAAAPEPDNIFHKCGDAWEVRFNGGEKFMMTTGNTGAAYLHFMLARPNIPIPVTEIILKVFGEPENGIFRKRIDDDDFESGYSISSLPSAVADALADDMANRQYRQKLTELTAEITEAENDGNNVTAGILLQDLEALIQEMQRVTSMTGQNRRLNDPLRRIDNSFRNAINRVIMKVAEFDEAMATHLKTSISCGMNPIYVTEENIDWKL